MKSILITGGTGSFGQAFVRRLLDTDIWRIAVYARGEHAHEDMERAIPDFRIRHFVGDIRDLDRLEMAMRNVDTVVHAAALKVVPIAEYNPTECIATNVGGAENVVKAALRAGVRTVIALSTDKAVNPINLYGASKLAAEKVFIAANALSAGSCTFSVVRYGNVVGSRGSVVPLFKKIAAEGRRLTITDTRMTRFWITMDQAIDLVFRAIHLGVGRRIYVPRIPSMRVTDLAEAIAPGKDILITGIRPGEKLHECLLTEDEGRTTVDNGSFFTIHPPGSKMDSNQALVPQDWRYSSDTNTEWLTVEELQRLL